MKRAALFPLEKLDGSGRREKKSVRMFQLYWDLEIEFRIYLHVSQLKRDKKLIWG